MTAHRTATDRARAHRIAKAAAIEAEMQAMEPDEHAPWRAASVAARHLASLPPERRALLEREWL